MTEQSFNSFIVKKLEQQERISTLWQIARWAGLAIIVGALFNATVAEAGGKPQPPRSDAEASAFSSSAAGAFSRSEGGYAVSTGGVAASEGGSASATSGDASADNALTINNVEEDKFTIKNTPNMSLGGVYPANACHRPVQAGVSLPGVGVSGGGVVIDPVCQKLEACRIAFGFGLRDAALHCICETEQMNGNPFCTNDATKKWQDREMEIGALTDNANIMQGQLDEAHSDIVKLQEENQRLRNEVSTQRLEQAVTK